MKTPILIVLFGALPALAQPAPLDYGFNFVTIGDPANAPYTGFDRDGHVTGHGSVGYEYRIARTEVTTAQYIEFLNGLIDAGVDPNLAGAPQFMGGGFSFGTGRWGVAPGGEMLPVAGVSWRDAAIFMNWLHNGKTNTIESFLSGAYDISTFNDTRPFTDQTTRSPGAKYWIPSLDEWMKAAHYDPHRNGPDQGGWWLFNNSSDTQPVPGLPGVGETSAGLAVPANEAFSIPLESYPETQTPWGLLDTSGGGGEWTEEWLRGLSESRIWFGNTLGETSWSPNDPFGLSLDQIWAVGADRPNFPFSLTTFRVASLVPAPGVGMAAIALVAFSSARRRRA